MNETGLFITFEKQPILLNMIVSGNFTGLLLGGFVGIFAVLLTKSVSIMAVINIFLFAWAPFLAKGRHNM